MEEGKGEKGKEEMNERTSRIFFRHLLIPETAIKLLCILVMVSMCDIPDTPFPSSPT